MALLAIAKLTSVSPFFSCPLLSPLSVWRWVEGPQGTATDAMALLLLWQCLSPRSLASSVPVTDIPPVCHTWEERPGQARPDALMLDIYIVAGLGRACRFKSFPSFTHPSQKRKTQPNAAAGQGSSSVRRLLAAAAPPPAPVRPSSLLLWIWANRAKSADVEYIIS